MSFRFKCAIAMFVFSCGVPGPVSAGPFEDGLHALEGGNYERAMRLLQPLAAEGDARAQYQIKGTPTLKTTSGFCIFMVGASKRTTLPRICGSTWRLPTGLHMRLSRAIWSPPT
jgi:hypothetical protein